MSSEPGPLKNAALVGKVLRIAPGRQGKPAANFWKFWVSGSEVYATTRSSGAIRKISVHESGQIHMRFEGKDLQQLAPPLLLGNGQWLHAFELRFLLSPDAYRPQTKNEKNKKMYLIEVPPDAVLIMNLIVGQVGCSAATDLPHELLPAARPLWRTTLKDQRPVVLTARVLKMDMQNRDALMHIRDEINPKVNFSKPLTVAPYVEITQVQWDAKGGNVVLVVPMGKDAIRVRHDPSVHSSSATIADSRTVAISCPSASIPIAAPNGAIVATLSIAGATSELALRKNLEVRSSIGTVMLSMNPSNLIFGEKFVTPPNYCPCVPTIDGVQPKKWEYSVFSYFDGATLRAEIRQLSTGLRNAYVEAPIPKLGTTEEIIMAAPIGGLVLETTASAPQSSAILEGSFLLRDI